MSALKEAQSQIAAAIVRAPLAPVELHDRARGVVRLLELAERTQRGYAAALAEAAKVLISLDRAQREASRDMRLTQRELVSGAR